MTNMLYFTKNESTLVKTLNQQCETVLIVLNGFMWISTLFVLNCHVPCTKRVNVMFQLKLKHVFLFSLHENLSKT